MIGNSIRGRFSIDGHCSTSLVQITPLLSLIPYSGPTSPIYIAYTDFGVFVAVSIQGSAEDWGDRYQRPGSI